MNSLYWSFAFIVVCTLGLATALVITGHPWFAALILLAGGSVSYRKTDDEGEAE